MSDAVIAQLRDQLYGIADLAIESQRRNATMRRSISKQQREDIDERAAIMEFDGHLPRHAAESAAASFVVPATLRRGKGQPH